MKMWWSARSPRERRLLWAGLALVVVIPTSALLWTVLDETTATQKRLAEKSRWLAAYLAEPTPLGNRRADQRLADALRAAGVTADRFELAPGTQGGWRLTLRAASFDALMSALAQGAAPGPLIRLELTAVGTGQVDGTLEFAPST